MQNRATRRIKSAKIKKKLKRKLHWWLTWNEDHWEVTNPYRWNWLARKKGIFNTPYDSWAHQEVTKHHRWAFRNEGKFRHSGGRYLGCGRNCSICNPLPFVRIIKNQDDKRLDYAEFEEEMRFPIN